MRKLTIAVFLSAVLLGGVSGCRSTKSTTPNVTLKNTMPVQIELTITSKKDKSEVKANVEANEEKKIHLDSGSYDVVSLFSEQGRMVAISSESTTVEGAEKWVFEPGMGGPRRNVVR